MQDTKRARYQACKIVGTRGRTRTGTGFTPTDFESVVSTNFTTLARWGGSIPKNISARYAFARLVSAGLRPVSLRPQWVVPVKYDACRRF